MRHERIPTSNAPTVSIDTAKAFARIDSDFEDAVIARFIGTVSLEIERHCNLALISQQIVVTTDNWPGCLIELPVGPVQSGASISVEVIEQDGTTTAVADGFWLEAGRYPRLHFSTQPGAPLRITYTAGFGPDAGSIPADLVQAICEQVTRLYDERGTDKLRGFCPATARICARYRRVRV